jgi:hypothetical protein
MTHRRHGIGLLLALLLAGTTTSGARADDQTCNDSYEQGQVLRKRDNKLLSAREQFRTCVNVCTLEALKKGCSTWLTELEADIPTVVLSARDGSGTSLVDVTVEMDGKPLATKLDGRPIEVDPGSHSFMFIAPDGTKQQAMLNVAAGQRNQLVSATIAPPPAPLPPPPAAPPLNLAREMVPPPSPPATTIETASGGSSLKTVGLVIGGVGVAGLVAGTFFGVLAVSAKSSYQQHCGSNIGAPPGACDDQGVSGPGDASSKATLSTAFLVGGGVAAAAGVTLFLIAPRGGTAPQVGVGPTGIFARGTF